MKKISRLTLVTLFSTALLVSGQAPSPAAQQPSPAAPKATATSKKAAAAPSAQDIADAKSKGLVWVNTSTRVYHKQTSSLYGATKHGKFMSEDDAKKAGYRAANESGAAKK